MSYDSPDFRVQMMHGPIFGSFSAILATTSKTQTTEDCRDRVEFFRNIKLLDFKVLPKVASTSGDTAAGVCTKRIILQVGSDTVATAVLVGTGVDVGTMINGGIGSGTLAEVTSNEEVNLALTIVGDGTVETHGASSVEAYLLYEHRFA